MMHRRYIGWLFLVAAILILVFAPSVVGPFTITLLSDVGIAALVVIGLVLVFGIGGVISFGQAAFVGLAAYTSAVAAVGFGVAPWLNLVMSLVVTCVFAAMIGSLTLRLGGHYLALSTIAWGLAVPLVFANTTALGGHTGIDGIPKLTLAGWDLSSGEAMFRIIWIGVLLGWLFARNLLNGRVGRCIRALRGGQQLLGSIGADPVRLRIHVFVLASGYAALAGWLYAYNTRFVSATPFSLHASVDYVFMMILGGMREIVGAVVGSALYIEINDLLQNLLPKITDRGSQMNSLIFAIVFLFLIQRFPDGLVGLLRLRIKSVPVSEAAGPSSGTVESLDARTLPETGHPILKVDGIGKKFGGLTAVDGVSFTINAGEIVGLIGPNGAGKSTTFNLITGVLRRTSGSIGFLGSDIGGLRPEEIARLGISRTFQHVRLIKEMSVLENVALGAYGRGRCGLIRGGLQLDRAEERAIREEAWRQIERVGLTDYAHQPAGSLALGIQRLVEVARALASDPVLVILDEPAAGLRAMEKEALGELLGGLQAQGVSILIVEHDMGFVMRLVDRLVVMNFGQKIFEGSPAETQKDARVLEAYLGE